MADAQAAPTPQLQLSAETYISKLTLKGMGCNPGKVVALPAGEKCNLARIFGTIQDVKVTESKTIAGNLEVAFQGNFEGINLETGEVFRSGRLYLPKGISELMEQNLIKYHKEDAKASVSFAFEIRSVHATNPIGYSYEAQAIQSAQKVDELAELRKAVMALPAAGDPTPKAKQLDTAKGKK
jgi:hypothetical protein